jgi:hypothetical protein
MSERTYPVWLLVLAVLLAGPRTSSADPVVIYSNFGASPGYLSGPWTSGSNAWVQSEGAGYFMGFELSEPASLTSIVLPVARPAGETGPINLQLLTPETPFTVIESWTLSLPASGQGVASMVSAESTIQPLLAANTLYFLWLRSSFPSSSPDVIWPWNNAGVQGTIRQVGFTNQTFVGTLSAFQVNGELSPIPEPGTMLLLGTGAAFLVQRVRERRRV